MTPYALRAALDTLGWSERQLAQRWGGNRTLIRRMLAGKRPVDPELSEWLTMACRWFSQHPLPRKQEHIANQTTLAERFWKALHRDDTPLPLTYYQFDPDAVEDQEGDVEIIRFSDGSAWFHDLSSNSPDNTWTTKR